MAQRKAESAGALLYRRQRGMLEVLLVKPGGPYWRKRDEGAWSIPKGVVESNDVLACARREFNEETGLVAAGDVVPLTPQRQRSGKLVHAFALEADFDLSNFSSNMFEMEWPPRSGRMQSFPEIDRVAWFDLQTADTKILASQRPFLERLRAAVVRAAWGNSARAARARERSGDGVFEAFAGAEARHFAGRDLDGLAGARIAAFGGRTLRDDEGAEAGEAHLATLLQLLGD